jgi:hypothetical protein
VYEPLPANGPSDDFCSEACQGRWTRRHQGDDALDDIFDFDAGYLRCASS